MHIRSRSTGTIFGYALGGDRSAKGTVEVNFAPKAASASVAISETGSGDGFSALGIRSFEYRDSPSGPNKKDFGGNAYDWPPSAYHKLMTRVTFGMHLYPDSICAGSWTLDFWS